MRRLQVVGIIGKTTVQAIHIDTNGDGAFLESPAIQWVLQILKTWLSNKLWVCVFNRKPSGPPASSDSSDFALIFEALEEVLDVPWSEAGNDLEQFGQRAALGGVIGDVFEEQRRILGVAQTADTGIGAFLPDVGVEAAGKNETVAPRLFDDAYSEQTGQARTKQGRNG